MPQADPNIEARILLDSVNKHGDRLTTFSLTFPRFILAELATHRMFSKNAASSRAIPVKKQIEKVRSNPVIPSWIGKNQKGMQAAQEADEETTEKFLYAWKHGANSMANLAEHMAQDLDIHKQIANRIIEPWSYITVILSATEFQNFFGLRCHKDAQPEFQVLAYRMLEAYVESEPQEIEGWHIPYGDRISPGYTEQEKILIACGRIARVSYENHDGEMNEEDDMKLANNLIKAGHMSPFEHVARASNHPNILSGNFKGWIQYRKTIQGECRNNINLMELLAGKPDWII